MKDEVFFISFTKFIIDIIKDFAIIEEVEDAKLAEAHARAARLTTTSFKNSHKFSGSFGWCRFYNSSSHGL